MRANMVGSTAIGDEYERLDRGLPLRQIRFLLWQIGYVGRRVEEGAQLFAVGEDDRIVEFS